MWAQLPSAQNTITWPQGGQYVPSELWDWVISSFRKICHNFEQLFSDWSLSEDYVCGGRCVHARTHTHTHTCTCSAETWQIIFQNTIHFLLFELLYFRILKSVLQLQIKVLHVWHLKIVQVCPIFSPDRRVVWSGLLFFITLEAQSMVDFKNWVGGLSGRW